MNIQTTLSALLILLIVFCYPATEAYGQTFTLQNGANLQISGGGVLNLGATTKLSEDGGLITAGSVRAERSLNSPSNENVGGLGAIITSSSNLGLTVVTRTNAIESIESSQSISRFYDINPANNSGLDATLVFTYNEGELNNLDEDELVLFRSDDDGVTYTQQGFDSRDAAANTITLGNISSFSRWTAAATLGTMITYVKGWNLAGVPTDTDPTSYETVFTEAVQAPFIFESGSYQDASQVEPGFGYWVLLDDQETVTFDGDNLDEINLNLDSGWNLVSGIGYSISEAVIEDNDGIINSAWYLFNGAYQSSSSIDPGYGYWVRASQAGTVTLEHQAAKSPDMQTDEPWIAYSPEESFHGLHFVADGDTLQTLWFGDELPEEVPSARFVLPPVPPSESFDARFNHIESRLAEGDAPVILIQSGERDLEIVFSSPSLSMMNTWKLVQSVEGQEVDRQSFTGDEAIALYSSQVTHLEVKQNDGLATGNSDLPNHFGLEQNYPNPFNPSTQIRFQLPESSHVLIEVFDLLGRRVSILVDEQMQAGNHIAEFNANHLTSGVYVYRMSAGQFTETRRLTLIK